MDSEMKEELTAEEKLKIQIYDLGLRVLLAILTSPIWLPCYLIFLFCGYAGAIVANLVLFIGKGEFDGELFEEVNKAASLSFLRNGARR